MPVNLAVLLEFREVVDEGGVNYGIRAGCSAAQAFQIFEITSMHLGAGGGQRLCARIGACKTEHLMAGVDEFRHDGGTDKACGACDEDTHMFPPGLVGLPLTSACLTRRRNLE